MGLFIYGGNMRKVVFIIDGWFMRKRIYSLNAFYYSGPEIRKYCKKHLRQDDTIYRIFYYDTRPFQLKAHNPITKELIDFSQTSVAKAQDKLFDSIKKHRTLRLGLEGQTGQIKTGF
jgi:hypothetical protein